MSTLPDFLAGRAPGGPGRVQARPPKQTCNGFVGRYLENTFHSQRDLVAQTRKVQRLKRLTCRGCEACGGHADMVEEYCREDPDGVEFADNLQHNDLVTAKYVHDGYDGPEDGSGYGHIKFVKLEDV